MEIRSGVMDEQDARIFYEEAGHGFPLVLVHSAASDSRMWDEQFLTFAREYRTIRYDLRGFGRSESDPVPFSHTHDLHILLRLLEVQQAFLIGCGLGAHTILDFSLSHPRMAAGLVLVNPVSHEAGKGSDRLPEMNGNGGSLHEPDGILPVDPAIVRRLGKIRIPTIVITGEQSAPEIIRTARLLYTSIPDAIKANLPGAAVLPNLERPNQFNRIVLTFFDWIKSRWGVAAVAGW